MSNAEVARMIFERVGEAVVDVTPMPYGHACETYSIIAAGRTWIVKISDDATAFDHTIKHLGVLAALGVPVPRDARVECWGGVGCLIYEALPGRDLGHELGSMTREQMTRLAEQVVGIQRSVGTLPGGHGYGWTPMGVPGPFASWLEVLQRDSADSPQEVKDLVGANAAQFASQPATCFLDDITVKNVIVEDGELCGIVDLDFFCYGDPMYWLALTETTVVLDVGFDALFYCDELRRYWRLTASEELAVGIYRKIHASTFMRRADLSTECRQRMERFYALTEAPFPIGVNLDDLITS